MVVIWKVSDDKPCLYFELYVYVWDLTIQYGENKVAHRLDLKEVSAKAHPGKHEEEEVALKHMCDANAEAESLIAELEETQI